MTTEQIITMIACFVMGYSACRMIQIHKANKIIKNVQNILNNVIASAERHKILNSENTKPRDEEDGR